MKLNRLHACRGLAAGSLALTACGGSSGGRPTPAQLTGRLGRTRRCPAASTAPARPPSRPPWQAWQAAFQAANPDVTVNYDPVGSGGGREQFLAGGVTVRRLGRRPQRRRARQVQDPCCGGTGAIDLPVYVSPIAIAYNLPGVDKLQLSPTRSPRSSPARSPSGTTRRSPPTTRA